MAGAEVATALGHFQGLSKMARHFRMSARAPERLSAG